tara:strand:- start:2986 stop:3195 length:210 start_codon:yes stop_codon:yes gene_type:complete
MNIVWRNTKGLLTGTLNTVKYGELKVEVVKDTMCYTAQHGRYVIGRSGYKEEAKQLCVDYLAELGLVEV